MRYTKEKQQEHLNRIRRILVIKSDATIFEVKDTLAVGKNPLKLDKDYINKMMCKIKRERNKRFMNYTVKNVLAGFQDEVEELKKNLWVIINGKSEDKDKVAAIRELRNSSKDLFDKMFDSGIFEKKIGELRLGLFDYTKQNENRPDNSNKKVAENDEENKGGPGRNERE